MLNKVSVYIFYAIPILLIIDFSLPGKEIITKVNAIKTNRQSYYNAGGNSHLTYTITTKESRFTASKEFVKKIDIGNLISIKKSLVFKEINSCSFNGFSETYSLRLFSGLILPFLVMVILLAQTKFNLKISALALIFKIMLVGNLIYVIFN
jgi:hypothetical protein